MSFEPHYGETREILVNPKDPTDDTLDGFRVEGSYPDLLAKAVKFEPINAKNEPK